MDDDSRRLDEDAEVTIHIGDVEYDAAGVDLHILAEPAVEIVPFAGKETEYLAIVAELHDLGVELARVARAAGLKARHDLVTDLERLAREVGGDVLAESDDFARAFMAELNGADAEGIALVFMHVSAAYAAAFHLDENLVIANGRKVDFDDFHLPRFLENRNLALSWNAHFASPVLFDNKVTDYASDYITFMASISNATRKSFGNGRALTIQRQAAAMHFEDEARICT